MEATEARIRATELSGSMREHKRAIRQHRQALQSDGEQLASLRAICEEFGIALIIETPSVGRPHGSARPQDRIPQRNRHH